MTDFDKEEFWQALGRLYDSSVKLNEFGERLLEIVTKHEKRLDRTEVTLEALQEDMRRFREGRAS